MQLPKRSRSARIERIVISVVVAILLFLGIMLTIMHFATPAQVNAPPTQASKPVPKVSGLTSRELFMGDVYWGRYINDWSQASALKTAYPFSRLNEFHRDQYDAWIADLECPTVPGVHISSAEEDATLNFNCDPSYLPEAVKWFTAFTLANNHTDNQGGQTGLDTTRQELEKQHIQYFGHYDPDVLSDVCEVISLPVRATLTDGSETHRFLPVAMCGYHGVFKIPSDESLAVMQRYAKVMPVIAFPHSGKEYVATPDQIKTTLYRGMIDNGADVVLGDHPHWIQPSEAYKGHLIVYAMNNFIFDQQDTQEVTRAAAVDLTLSLADGADTSQLGEWLDLGDTCKAFKDDCLEQAEAKNLTKLDLNWQFAIIGSRDNGRLAHPATEAETAGILQRLNWANAIKGLQAPYSAS